MPVIVHVTFQLRISAHDPLAELERIEEAVEAAAGRALQRSCEAAVEPRGGYEAVRTHRPTFRWRGNAVSKDIDCQDQPYAFRVYADGLNGQIGRRYDWSHGQSRGYFTPTREFRRGGVVCRDFTETSYRGGRAFTRTGTACRQTDGNWRFD